MEPYVTIKGLPRTIRTDESTASTGREFGIFANLQICNQYTEHSIQKLLGIVETGIKTPKYYLRRNLEEGYNKKCFKMLIEYNENNGLLKCKRDAVRMSLWSNTKNGNTRLVEYITEYTLCYINKTRDTSELFLHEWQCPIH